MPQFTIYQNRNPQTCSAVPFLLDIQNDLFSDLETRVVVPLRPVTVFKGKTLGTLTPILDIEGSPFVLMTPELAGIMKSELGTPVTRVEHRRFEIISAIDMLLTGL